MWHSDIKHPVFSLEVSVLTICIIVTIITAVSTTCFSAKNTEGSITIPLSWIEHSAGNFIEYKWTLWCYDITVVDVSVAHIRMEYGALFVGKYRLKISTCDTYSWGKGVFGTKSSKVLYKTSKPKTNRVVRTQWYDNILVFTHFTKKKTTGNRQCHD